LTRTDAMIDPIPYLFKTTVVKTRS